MWLSGIAGHGARSMVFQWDSTMSAHSHKLAPRLVPQLWSTASYLPGPLVSSSGAIIVAVLQPVPFPKCASSNYKATQNPHTNTTQQTRHITNSLLSAKCHLISRKLHLFLHLSFSPWKRHMFMKLLFGLLHGNNRRYKLWPWYGPFFPFIKSYIKITHMLVSQAWLVNH